MKTNFVCVCVYSCLLLLFLPSLSVPHSLSSLSLSPSPLACSLVALLEETRRRNASQRNRQDRRDDDDDEEGNTSPEHVSQEQVRTIRFIVILNMCAPLVAGLCFRPH